MKRNMILFCCLAFVTYEAGAQQKAKPEDTEFYIPVPKVVDPGKAGCGAPSDAIILFDGTNADQWVNVTDSTTNRPRGLCKMAY